MRLIRSAIFVSIVAMTAACAQTDAGITTAVKSSLAADDEVKAYQINVDTSRKVVTLSGNVDTVTAKRKAVEIARKIDGVANVVDNLKVSGTIASETRPSDVGRATFTDGSLTAAVKTKLLGDPAVSGLKIDVDTENGVVSLNGQVRTQAEKEQALKLARETDGVKSVTDRLTVRP